MEKFIKIGNVKIKKTAALAPMASVADTAYRLICKKFKAALVYSEMVSVKGIYYGSKNSNALLNILEEERPMAIQLFGEDPKFFALALEKVLEKKPDLIDLNMGCPVNKVVKNGAGCKLMQNVELAEKIACVVVKNSNVPVTVKLRKGWDEKCVNVCEFAKRMENCGVSAITVHGRTREEMFSKKADWEIISRVKENVSIPVIANGDIKTVSDCTKVYEKTNADLIMIGRGSFGRPWIFKQIDEFLSSGEILKEPNILEITNVMLEHIKKIFEMEREEIAVKKSRAQAMRYFYGFKNAAKIRRMCCKFNSFDDVLKLREYLLNSVKN